MKRTLAWVLLFVMLLGMFAGCKKQEAETPTTPAPTGEVVTASDAMEYVKAIYPNTEEALKTPIDYERMGVVRISDIPFTVVWTTDLSEDLIKIVPSEDGTMVTIDINEQCEADTPYVLTATITDEAGNVATHSWNCILPKAVDMVSLVEQAYALKKGESLPFECTLIGKIISIDKPFDPDYQNITVTIAVAGAEKKPIQCYRLKGDGAKDLMVGNIITVTGTIKNYNGTIEFDAGCILEAVEKGDAVEAPTDVGEILKAAYKLKKGKALPYPVELTGVVTEIDKPYDPGYKNISVVIEVEGYSKYPILCYRLKGKDAENIAVGDTITVNGIIKNYEGTIEYDAGCQMLKRVSGGGVALKPSSDENKILRDAKKLKEGQKLAYIATLTGEVISVDSAYDPGYKNVTVTMMVAGTKIQCYRMKGDDASKVRVTDKITVTGQIENYYGKLEFGSGCTLDKWVKGSRVVKIDMGPLAENTAYKMEMKLPTLGKNVYFNGKISNSHYLQTGTYEESVEVFMEKTEKKGVRFYFLDGETKTYIEIKMVDVTDKEGKTSKKARPQLATNPSVYWTYSEDAGVYTVDIDGTKYYLGTYLNNGTVYETASCSSIYYITDANAKNKGKTQFYFEFVTKASDAPDVPVEPEKPSISGLPSYNAALQTGDKVVIYAPAYSKALSTEKVSHYNKGVDLTVKNNALSGYGNSEIFTVTVNADGTYSFANGGKNIAMADQFSSMNLGEKHDKWQLISLGNGLFNIKNVGRSSFMEWYDSMNNWSAYTSANGDQFEMSIYVIDKGVLTQAADTPEQPDTPDAPELPTEDGAVISIADAIAAGKAMAHDTYTELKYKVTGEIVEVYQTVYGNMRIKDTDGNILTIYGTYDATGKIRYDAMEVKPVAGDTVTIYGPVGQFKDTPQIKNGWIVEHIPAEGTDPEQPPVEPDEPDVPDTPVTGNGVLELTVESLGLDEKVYYTGDATVDGIALDLTQIGNYGDGIQMRDKDGKTSILFNKNALGGKITKIELTYSSTKEVQYANADAVIFSFGAAQDNLSYTTKLSTVVGEKSYTIIPEGDNTFFKIEHDVGFSFYWDSIKIYYEAATTPDEPETSAVLKDGDKIVIYVPAYNKALSMDKVSEGAFYNKGVDVTLTGDVLSGYGEAEIWTVVANEDGTFSFTGKDGKNIGMQDSYATLTQGAVNDDWQLVELDNGTYALKNTVRGNHLQWSTKFNNYSTYTGDPATDDQYQLKFYVVTETTDEPETPPVTPEEPETPPVTPDEPETTTVLKNGDKIVIYVPAYNKALSMDKVSEGSYYNKGVDVTLTGDVLSGYGEAEIWTVVANEDGTFSFTGKDGKNIGMQDSYATLSQGAVNDDWQLVELDNGTYALKNTVRGNHLQWSTKFNNYSTYTGDPATDDQYQLKFYVVAETTDEPETPPVTPEEPETPAEGGYVKVTDAAQLTNGQYVMIVNTGYAPGKLDGSWVSAVQPVVSGNSVTDAAGGVWTLTFNGSSVTITDANGVSIAPKGGNSNGIKSAAYDWAWSFENGAMTFAGVGGDTVVLASNSDAQYGNKFRAYKTSTVGGYPDVYPSEFTLYKLAEK